MSKWLDKNRLTDAIKSFIVDEKSFVVDNEVIILFKINEEWADQNLDLFPNDELVLYKSNKVCIQSEVLGLVKVQVVPPKYGEYGDEITPALYKMAEGIAKPAIYKGYDIFINTSSGDLIVKDFFGTI
jgi:hypothetical protein